MSDTPEIPDRPGQGRPAGPGAESMAATPDDAENAESPDAAMPSETEGRTA